MNAKNIEAKTPLSRKCFDAHGMETLLKDDPRSATRLVKDAYTRAKGIETVPVASEAAIAALLVAGRA